MRRSPDEEEIMFGKRLRLRWFLGGIAVTAAIFVVDAPLATAARSHRLACQPDPGHWVSVTDDQGIPTLELVGTTVCTDAVTEQAACTLTSPLTQPSPYPGWVQVTDEIGVPWLYQTGSAPASTTVCLRTNGVSTSTTTTTTAPTSPQPSPPPMKSPDPGWVVVVDDQGVPWLEPI